MACQIGCAPLRIGAAKMPDPKEAVSRLAYMKLNNGLASVFLPACDSGKARYPAAKITALAALLLTRLLLLSLPEQIIQGGIDTSLVNVAPEGAIGSQNPI